MNRKLLNGLLLVAASCAAVGTFTSCKDEISDLRAEMNEENAQLAERIKALDTRIQNLDDAYKKADKVLEDKIKNLLIGLEKTNGKIDDLDNKIDDLDKQCKKFHDELLKRIEELEKNKLDKDDALTSDDVTEIFNGLFEEAFEKASEGLINTDDLLNYLTKHGYITEDQLDNLRQEIENKGYINTSDLINYLTDHKYITEDQLPNILDDLGYITQEQLNKALSEIATCACDLTKLQEQIDALKATDEALSKALEEAEERINNRFTTNEERIKALEDALEKGTGLTVDEINALIAEQLIGIQATLDDLSAQFDQNKTELEAQIDELKKQLESNTGETESKIEDLTSQITDLNSQLENVNSAVSDLNSTITDVKNDLQASIDAINEHVSSIDSTVTNLTEDMVNALYAYTYIKNNETKLNVLLGLADDLSDRLEGMENDIAGLNQGLERLTDTVKALQTDINKINDEIKVVKTEFEDKLNNLKTDLGNQLTKLNEALTADINKLTEQVNKNTAAISDLQTKVGELFNITANLTERFDKTITSIITQGTYNPLFGTFSLPIGVQSNMLVNYTGQNDHRRYSFPSYNTFASYNNEPMLTQADENMLKQSGNFQDIVLEEGGLLYNDLDDAPGKLYLGKIFTTINPNNIDFGGQYLTLVNSRDEAAPVELYMKKSNELLDFGYTRADNGFYEADALVPASTDGRDNFDKIMLRIDDRLKEAGKELLKDRSRSTVLGLMKGLYEQLSGILPAYGLKATWNVDGKEYATYSNYNIAATTFRPLSYSFLYGKSIDRRLPIIDALSESLINIDASKYKFNIPDFNLSGVSATLNFTFKEITLDADADLVINAWVEIEGKQYPVEGTVDGLENFLQDINNSLNEQIDGWNDQLHTAFDDAIAKLIEDLQKDINATMADMRAEINGKLEQMINDIQNEVNNRVGQYLDKFNNFISKYNELAKKINNVLVDPNHYLQLTMAYNNGKGGIHFLSNNINRPTELVIAGGDVLELYPTSYTGEVLAPAYRKFIGCTNVIKDGKSAQNQDGDMVKALKKINTSGEMNKVFKGVQRRYPLPIPKDVVKGATYELVYTAVDYHGTTSTAKFYFTVK